MLAFVLLIAIIAVMAILGMPMVIALYDMVMRIRKHDEGSMVDHMMDDMHIGHLHGW